MELRKYGLCLLGVALFGFVNIGYKIVWFLENKNSYISTSGIADRIIKADYAKLNISIINETDSLKEVKEKRKFDRELVKKFLSECGFESQEIKDGPIDVSDCFALSYEKIKDGKRYKIIDTIIVETKNVDLMEETVSEISGLVDKDIFIDTFLKYSCRDINKLRKEMIKEATKDSMIRAKYIAESSNSKITGLKNSNIGEFSMSPEEHPAAFRRVDYNNGESSVMKRFRVVVNASFDFKNE